MKISVIMSTYNEGDGTQLKQAVDSILQQTFGEFEFIICDDGYTDNNWMVLKKMKALDQRIINIHNRVNKK